MTKAAWVLTALIMGALLITIIISLVVYYRANVWNPTGKGSKEKARRILKRHARLNGMLLLEDTSIRSGGTTVHAEHILAGKFGLLFIKTCGERGEYYGNPTDSRWVIIQNGIRRNIPNYFLEQEQSMDAVRSLLAANQIYKVPMEQAVWFSSKSQKTILCIGDERALASNGLTGLLGKTRFEKDNSIDPRQIANLLQARESSNGLQQQSDPV